MMSNEEKDKIVEEIERAIKPISDKHDLGITMVITFHTGEFTVLGNSCINCAREALDKMIDDQGLSHENIHEQILEENKKERIN